jgi:hypothetical protein
MNNLKQNWSLVVKNFSVVFLFLFFNSCIKENVNLDKISDESQINGTISLPLAHGEFTMKDIIESQDSFSMVKYYTNPSMDSMLYMLYNTTILSKTAGDFVILKDQNFIKEIKCTDPGFPVSYPIAYKDSNYRYFGVTDESGVTHGEEIDSLILKAGTLNIQVKSTFYNTGTLKIIAPNLTKNGAPLQVTVPINVADGTFNSSIISRDLTGYKFQVSDNGEFNKVKIIHELTLQSGGKNITSALTLTTNINSLKFSKLYGYIGTRALFDNTGLIVMNIFDVKDKTKIEFKNPLIKLCYQNSLGIPMKVDFHDMKVYSVLNNETVNLVVPTPGIIKSAESVTKPTLDTLFFTKDNSTIQTAMAKIPRDFYYGLKTTVNPVDKPKNFLMDTSTFKASLEVELPMEVKLGRYEHSDTFSFDMGSTIKDFSIIDSLRIFYKIANKFPVDATIQLLLMDDHLATVDTLFTSQPVVKADSTINKSVLFTQKRVLQFERVKKAKIHVVLNSKDYQTTFVKFYLRDKIKFSLGARATIKVNSTDQL